MVTECTGHFGKVVKRILIGVTYTNKFKKIQYVEAEMKQIKTMHLAKK